MNTNTMGYKVLLSTQTWVASLPVAFETGTI